MRIQMGTAILILPCSSVLSSEESRSQMKWFPLLPLQCDLKQIEFALCLFLSSLLELLSLGLFFFLSIFCEKYHPYWMHLKRNPCPVKMLEAIVRKIRVFKPHMANCLLTPLSSVIVQFVLLTQQGELEILKFPSTFFLFIFKGESKSCFLFFFFL